MFSCQKLSRVRSESAVSCQKRDMMMECKQTRKADKNFSLCTGRVKDHRETDDEQNVGQQCMVKNW